MGKLKEPSSGMKNTQLRDTLFKFEALRDNDRIDMAVQDMIAPVHADDTVFQKIDPRITKALQNSGVTRLYAHQAEAIGKSLAGADIVLEAPTASGKTLSFAIPMMQRLLHGGHALMIYPMKAVANDQRTQLVEILKSVDLDSRPYDGDTDTEHRKLIRQCPPPVLITNPEMINGTFLGWNEKWNDFLKNLRFVVIDEMHEYRGYFGSNMSLLLRRFSHHLERIGTSPQFFLATATCANPEEHAKNLTGRSFELVSVAGKLSPRRQFVFIDPDIPEYNFYSVFQLRIRNAALACLSENKAVIVFCPSIKFAESCYRSTLGECDDQGLDKNAIALFKAGITADEKTAIQKGLKDGSKKLVFSTNALELGIDVGGLDGVILAGFPDTVMSAWQRIGRAGRSWSKDAFVLYYAMNNPVDKFHAANLQAFLDKPLDEIVADPSNEELIANHLPSLAHESEGNILSRSKEILGEPFYNEAVKRAKPVKGYRPQHHLNLRGIGGKNWILKYHNDEVGSMSDYHRFKEAYVNAILLHSGRKYKVDSVTEGSTTNEVQLVDATPEHATTRPHFMRNLDVKTIFSGFKWNSGVAIHLGKTYLYEVLNSFSVVDERNDSVIDRNSPQGHSVSSTSHAFWIDTDDMGEVDDKGLLAFEHLLRIGAMFAIPADLHDTTTHTKDKACYLIENYPGGIGIVKKTMQQWHQILRAGMKVAHNCKCAKGCPNCIIPPRYYRSDGELDKSKGIELAENIINATNGPPDSEFKNGLWM